MQYKWIADLYTMVKKKEAKATITRSKQPVIQTRTLKKSAESSDGMTRFLLDQMKSIRLVLNKFSKTKDPALMHPLRVSIKKIRAVHLFLESYGNREASIKGLLKIFRRAGKIRELHILRTHDNIHKLIPAHVLSLLEKKEKKQIEKCLINLPSCLSQISKIETAFQKRKLAKAPVDFHPFFQAQLLAAQKDLASEKRDRIHKLRKRIKRIIYLTETFPEIRHSFSKKEMDLLKNLQKKIGDWHDVFHSLTILDPYAKDPMLRKKFDSLQSREEVRFRSLLLTLKGKQFMALLSRINKTKGAI